MAKSKTRGNGEGTIYYIESKKLWACQYTLGRQDDGKLKRKTLYGKTRKDVKTKLDSLIAGLKTDTYVDKDKNNITLYDIALEIIEDGYRLNKLGDSAYKRKKETLNKLNNYFIATKPIQDVTEGDLKEFLFSITNYSNSVISKVYGLAKTSLDVAVRKNLIRYNFLNDKTVFSKPKSNKATKKVTAFSIEEQKIFIEKLKKHPHTKYKEQMLLSLCTGLRMGEINALMLDDIDFKNNKISVKRTITRDINDKTVVGKKTKTYAGQRDVFFNDEIKNILKEYLKFSWRKNPQNLIFYDFENNKLITTSQVNMLFKRFCERCKIRTEKEVNQHMLRHTFATRCIESGMSAPVLQKLLGHTDIKTTVNTYCDVFDKYKIEHVNCTFEYLNKNGLNF